MHRSIEITVAPGATASLINDLSAVEGAMTISVQRGQSVKPVGDVINVKTLNSDADMVLRAAGRAREYGPVSISTASLDSLSDLHHQPQIRADHDEASWEEAETALRRHTRPNLNLILASAGGSLAAAAGLASSSGVTEATALVAAAIIAPAFEPVARAGLATVTRQSRVFIGAASSVLLIYGTVIATAVVATLLLRAAGSGYVASFLHSSTVHEVQHPPLVNLLLSAAGAVTGAVMVAAGRFTVLAGPVIALQLLPAMATIGIALELGDPGIAARALGRVGIDVGMILIACLAVFTYKYLTVHGRRRPLS